METETPITQTDATPDTAPEAPAPSSNGDTPEVVTQVQDSPAEARAVSNLFQFSGFVHIGPGAEDCEDGKDGTCGDPLHFHAWCRLPNKFQIASIRERAQAAKARTIRQLKDPETNKAAILQAELDAIREAGQETLVEELLAKNYWRDHLAAMKEIAEDEEGDFTHIEEDQARWKALTDMEESERPSDEYEELTRHLSKWNEEVDRLREEKQKPQREALMDKDVDELIELIRDDRIQAEADQTYMVTYSMYEWFVGTLKPRPADKGAPVDRVFGSVEHMQNAAPEVIEALEAMFAVLESEFGNRSAVRAEGN